MRRMAFGVVVLAWAAVAGLAGCGDDVEPFSPPYGASTAATTTSSATSSGTGGTGALRGTGGG